MSRTSKENQGTKYRSQGIPASIQGREVRSKNSQDQYVVFEREAREFLNYFTLSCLNYVTEEYHSHRRLIDTARKTHSKKSTLENRYENQGTRGIAKLSDGTNLTRCHVR